MKKYINRYSMAMTLAAMSLATISCSDKDSDKSIPESNHNITIRSVRFVNDDQVNEINTLAASKKPGTNGTMSVNDRLDAKEPTNLEIHSGAAFDFTTDLQTNAIEKQGAN